MPRLLAGSALAAALVLLAAGTQMDWELRVGASGGRLHWSFEQGQCQATTGRSPTTAYHMGVHHWACITCKRAQSRACRAAPKQTSNYNWDLRVGASGGRLHWSFEQGQCQATTGRSPTTTYHMGVHGWACNTCTRAQSQTCRATPKQTDHYTIKTASAAQIFSLVAIAAIVCLTALLTCERVLRAYARPPRKQAPKPDLPSGVSDELAKGRAALARVRVRALAKGANKATTAAPDMDDLGHIGRARQSIFETFAIPNLREEVLAKTTHEAATAAADIDEPSSPVGRARNSVFEMFAMPNLRGKVA